MLLGVNLTKKRALFLKSYMLKALIIY